MNLAKQIQTILTDLFQVAGFNSDQTKTITQKATDLWLQKSFFRLFELFTSDEQKALTEMAKTLAADNQNKELAERFFTLLSSLDQERHEKAMDILYDEAASIIERMLKQFNLKSTPEQQKMLSEKIAAVLNSNSSV